MILPIVAYGDPVLRKVGKEIDADFPNLQGLIDNMFETMYHAKGIGLAAPQIGKAIRIFLVDTDQILNNADDEEAEIDPEDIEEGICEVFINAQITEKSGTPWAYNEGCLSIPKVNEDVTRDEIITIEYYDRDFNFHTKTFDGMTARVILHEYDHIEGKLFTDHLSALRRRLLKRRLENITKGKVDCAYKMRFPNVSKKRK